MSVFANIIIVGTGKIAETSMKLALQEKTSETIRVYEYAPSRLSSLKKRAEKENVYYAAVQEKVVLDEELSEITGKTLIISANNVYIFPKEICNRDDIMIINYHSALLPKYAGMNATTWAIYHGETKGGITWHYVDSQIDHGGILKQKECEIENDMTALQLNRKYDQLATKALEEFLPSLMREGYYQEIVNQDFTNRSVYRLKDIPDEGVINLEKGTKFCYRLLRSMDYGGLRVFPMPIVKFESKQYYVSKYKHNKNLSNRKTTILLRDNIIKVVDVDGELTLEVKEK